MNGVVVRYMYDVLKYDVGKKSTIQHSSLCMYTYDFVVVQFYLGVNVIFFCFKLVIILYHTPKQREIKVSQG